MSGDQSGFKERQLGPELNAAAAAPAPAPAPSSQPYFTTIRVEQLVPLETVASRDKYEGITDISANMKDRGFVFDENNPVRVLECEGHYYIWDGHQRSFSALTTGIEEIQVLLYPPDAMTNIGVTADEAVRGEFRPSWYYDWQDAADYTRKTNNLPPVDWASLSQGVPIRPFWEEQPRSAPAPSAPRP